MLPRCYQYQISSCHTQYVLKYTNVAVILRRKAHVFLCANIGAKNMEKKNCRIEMLSYCLRSLFLILSAVKMEEH